MPPSKKKTVSRSAAPNPKGKSSASAGKKTTSKGESRTKNGVKSAAPASKTKKPAVAATTKSVAKKAPAPVAPEKKTKTGVATSVKGSKTASKAVATAKPKAKVAAMPSPKGGAAKIAPPAKKPTGKSVPPNGKGASVATAKEVASKHSLKATGVTAAVPAKGTRAPVSHPIAARKPVPPPPKKTNTSPDIVAKIRSAQAEKEQRKDLAQTPPKKTLTPLTPIPPVIKGQDRIVLMVRDPYWLHAHWDITRQTVDRAKAALVEQWHSVKPILRLLKLDDSGTTESAETVYRDLEIHGGVRNWYIDVDNPPSRFQIVMGYLTGSGRFYELVRSNTVSTPVPGGKEASDDHWADVAKDAERIYAMSGGYGDETQRGELSEVFEERLNRTMDIDVLSQFGSGAEGGLKRARQFHFDVDAELIVFGSTHPDAHVTIGTEPVKVRSDGTFSIRLPFPDRRQVLPATARSRDGVDEQTVVIAVERNTKVMEPLSMEGDEP